MNKNYNLPASTGLVWLKAGFKIMKTAPVATSGIVAFYLLLMLVAGMPGALLNVPFIDILLSGLVTPFGAVAIASCGRDVSKGIIPTIFQCYGECFKNTSVRNKLLLLGLIYGVCVILISLVFSWLSADDVDKWFSKDGKLLPNEIVSNFPWAAVLFGFVFYTALLCVTCFSPMLIPWKGMPLGKAFFFSLFVCLKNAGAFIVLGLLLALIATFGTTSLSALGAILGINSVLVVLWGLFITCWSYCTLWPIWSSIFGDQDSQIVSYTK